MSSLVTKRSKRNPVVEAARFLFCIMIVFWHARAFLGGGNPGFCGTAGYIAVEFFFLVSGYLLAAKAWSQRDMEFTAADVLAFLKGKICGVLPVFIFAFVGAVSKSAILQKMGAKELLFDILLSFWDTFLLRITGVTIYQFVKASWYVSAMLIGGTLLYALHRRYKDWFSFLIAPLGTMAMLGWLFRTYSSLDLTTGGFKLVAPGLLRALAEMSLGCVVFRFAQWLKQYKLTLFSSICLSLVNLGCIAITFYGATYYPQKRFDYIMVVLLALSVTIMFSEQTLYYRRRIALVDRVCFYLGGLSLPIYLNHLWVKDIFKVLLKGRPRTTGMAIYCVGVFIVSAFCLLAIQGVKSLWARYGRNIRRIFIREDLP